MLTYTLSASDGSLYISLYHHIRQDILNGSLPPGSRLPSKRSLAKHLGISVVTVENAYAQLQDEGYLQSRAKSGFFVSAIETSALPEVPPQPAPSFLTQPQPSPSPRVNLSSSRTAAQNFPFSQWARLMRDTLSTQREALMSPSPAGGIPALQEAICLHLRQFRSMSIQPEQVIVGAGTEYLYSLLIQLLGFDKKYAVEVPGYQKLAHIYARYQVDYAHIPIDDEGICVDMLTAQQADIAHISPSHHYPTGLVTPISRRYELLTWANSAPGRYIIEDDYDSEFRLSGKPIPTLQSIDKGQRVIYMNTFTKTLSPTIRIGYIVLPPHLVEVFYRQLGFYACTVSTFEQYTLARFILDGHFERHINRMRTHYRTVRDKLILALRESQLASSIEIRNADSGVHFLLTVQSPLSDQELLARCRQLGLSAAFLSQFYVDAATAPQHTLVISYSGLEDADIPLAVTLLEELLHTEADNPPKPCPVVE